MTSVEKYCKLDDQSRSVSYEDSMLESPCWHEGALEETVARYKAGEEKPLDWVETTRLLRKRAE